MGARPAVACRARSAKHVELAAAPECLRVIVIYPHRNLFGHEGESGYPRVTRRVARTSSWRPADASVGWARPFGQLGPRFCNSVGASFLFVSLNRTRRPDQISSRPARENQILRQTPSTLRLLWSKSAEPLGLRRQRRARRSSFSFRWSCARGGLTGG